MKLKTVFLRRWYRLRGELEYEGITVPLADPVINDSILDAPGKHLFEQPEILALAGLLRPSDHVLELGSGMGIVSGIFAKRLPGLRVTSYEANPALAPVIARLHQRNGISNVELKSALVAPTAMGLIRKFKIHKHFTESSLVAESADQAIVEVPVHDPDAVMAALRPDVLLCDIEGGEEELIPQLPLTGLRAAVIELHPHIVSRAGISRIFNAFLDAGLVPVVELSTATVVAFDRVAAP